MSSGSLHCIGPNMYNQAFYSLSARLDEKCKHPWAYCPFPEDWFISI